MNRGKQGRRGPLPRGAGGAARPGHSCRASGRSSRAAPRSHPMAAAGRAGRRRTARLLRSGPRRLTGAAPGPGRDGGGGRPLAGASPGPWGRVGGRGPRRAVPRRAAPSGGPRQGTAEPCGGPQGSERTVGARAGNDQRRWGCPRPGRAGDPAEDRRGQHLPGSRLESAL